MTQAEKFKVGDRVRIVSALGGQQCIYPAATTGWITEVRQREGFYCVLLEDMCCALYEGNQMERNPEGDETLSQYREREKDRCDAIPGRQKDGS